MTTASTALRASSRTLSDPDEIARLRAAGAALRDLHDAVTQALFAIMLHARAAELALMRAGIDAEGPAGGNVRQLHDLARRALAELRAATAAPGDDEPRVT